MADFLHPTSEIPAQPGRPQHNVTLRDLNVEQNPALWRTILENQDAAVAEVLKAPTEREGSIGSNASGSHSTNSNSNSNSNSVHVGSTASSGLRSSSSGRRGRGKRAQLDAVLFGADVAHAAAETARRRSVIDRAFEVSKKAGAEPKPGAKPPRTMQLSSQPAASKKLGEAMDGAGGVKG